MIEPVYNKVVDKIGIKAKFTGIFNSARSLVIIKLFILIH